MDAPAPSFLTTWAILDQTYKLLFKHLDRVLFQDGSSAPMASVLFALKQAGRPMRLSHLARIVVQEAQSMTSMVDRLETAGLLRRVPDKRDRRAINVALTPEGKRCAERLAASAEHAFAAHFTELPPAELEALTRMLQTLRHSGAAAVRFPVMPFERVRDDVPTEQSTSP